jgi:hypothetical protein
VLLVTAIIIDDHDENDDNSGNSRLLSPGDTSINSDNKKQNGSAGTDLAQISVNIVAISYENVYHTSFINLREGENSTSLLLSPPAFIHNDNSASPSTLIVALPESGLTDILDYIHRLPLQ